MRNLVLTLVLALAVTSCCRDEEGVTMSCTCTGVDDSGSRVPVTVPSGGCSDSGDSSAAARRFEGACEDRGFSDCTCSCTLLGQPCTYEHCST